MKTPEQMIEEAWADKSLKVNWLGYETTIRTILAEYHKRVFEAGDVIDLVSEATAAFTKRGYP